MRRDFEREFKELKMSEVPDLWNRIEAGLSDKKIVSPVSDAAAISVNRYNFGKRAVWRKWGTLAAACVCVALIIPAISLVIGNLGGRKSNYSGASFAPAADNSADSSMNDNTKNMTASSEMAADEGMADAAEMAPSESAAAESEMIQSEDETAASEIMADAESADMENSTNMTQTSGKESTSAATNGESALREDSLKKQASEDDVSDEKENVAMADEAIYAGLENGQILSSVIIEVTEASVSGEEVIYSTVIKQSDEDGLLNAGAGLSIVCNSDTSYAFIQEIREKKVLKVGESYEVSLRYEKNSDSQSAVSYANGRFVVVNAKKK